MKFANYSLFSTEQITKGLEYALDHTVDLGFDAVEWIDRADIAASKIENAAAARGAKSELDARDLTVNCYSLLLNLAAEDRDVQIERTFRHIEYASIIGAPYFHHTIIPHYDYSEINKMSLREAMERVADKAELVAKRCNEYGIVCLYEPQGIYFNGIEGLSAALAEMKRRGCNVGICGDTGNSMYVDTPPVEIFKAFKNDIKHVHVKDYVYGENPAAKQLSRAGKSIEYAPLGQGDADVKGCLDAIAGYAGNISFEMSDDDENMKKNIKFVKDALKI